MASELDGWKMSIGVSGLTKKSFWSQDIKNRRRNRRCLEIWKLDIKTPGTVKLLVMPRPSASIGEGNGTPLQYSCLEIPWTEEPARLQSMGLLRVGHD